jgi:enoyl-CoA hydratase/carnithine racemase
MLHQRIEDDILILTIENGKDNSLTPDFYAGLKSAIDQANNNPSPKGIIITGAGKFFSSGFNLPMFLSFKSPKEVAAFFRDTEEPILLDLFMCKKPVIAAMNGHSVAGGIILAMACDYKIATSNPKGKYGMSEIKIGLPLAIAQGEIVRWGMDSDRNFRDLMYFGQMMDVNGAKEKGLVDEIVAPEELMNRAKQVICTWIDNPGRAFTPIKHLFRRSLHERMVKMISELNWEESLKVFFQEDVRKTMEFVQMAMSK